MPGRGLCPGEREDAKEQEKQEGDTHEAAPRRRLSFMVGFWRKIKAKERGPGCSGPGNSRAEQSRAEQNTSYMAVPAAPLAAVTAAADNSPHVLCMALVMQSLELVDAI